MSDDIEQHLVEGLSSILLTNDGVDGMDDDLVEYIAGMMSSKFAEDPTADPKESINEVLLPFLDSVQCPEDLTMQAQIFVMKTLQDAGGVDENGSSISNIRKLQQGVVHIASSHQNGSDAATWNMNEGAIKARANDVIDAHNDKTSAKQKRRARKVEAEKARKLLSNANDQDPDQDGEGLLVSMNVRVLGSSSSDKKRDVLVRNATVSLGNGTVLLESAELKMAYQRRYGLIGENGVGKSTLLKAIARGEIDGFPDHLRVLHVRQEVPSNLSESMTVLSAVLNSDVELNMLMQREREIVAKLEKEGEAIPVNLTVEERRKKLNDSSATGKMESDLKELDGIYARLQVLSADSTEARASMILTGLQFSAAMQQSPLSSLSGGWKMRVALATALFIEPDVLMLDEPTNHLDLEAVLWLENYLGSYKHTLLVVSHDRGFLNEVCTDIIEFKKKTLTYYRGNFDNYVRLRDENIRNTMRLYHAYKEKRDHMMEFINKFRANAKRASMVQSRIKAVEKMDAEAPEAVEVDAVWRFAIPNSEPVGPPIIAVNDVAFDYSPIGDDGLPKSEDSMLLQKVNFGVDLTSRIAILGANGQGKTTLLNLVMGKLKPLRGSVSVNGGLRIGHFTQHSSDNFDLQLSATENLLNMFEDAEDLEMRTFLGKFQIQGDDALKPMMLLSGGQKSRVAFAALAFKKPHVLVIDEGSNHLSMEAVDALIAAVQDFKGGILVVSHDQYFVSKTCSELWVVDNGKATRFRGDFDEYKKHTAELTRKRVDESVKRISSMIK